MPSPNPQEQYGGVPRALIDWFPTIDSKLCQPSICHQECIPACPRNIFERAEDGSVIVARPYECTVGDISCSFACPFEAISFPSRSELKEMLSKAREHSTKEVFDELER
jgi:NAD-dependent dihydropyrimidine dehydrogenase PreA subunit